MSDLLKAAQQALEDLKVLKMAMQVGLPEYGGNDYDEMLEAAIEALRAALAQSDLHELCDRQAMRITFLENQRKPLTDEQINAIVRSNVTITDQNLSGAIYMSMRELEAAHGIKEQT